MNILVTGGAGFIGSTLVDELLKDKNNKVISIDNFDPFYDRSIKEMYVNQHKHSSNFEFHELDIRQIDSFNPSVSIDAIIHLAGKAGVRPSIKDSIGYFDVNLMGTVALLEFAKRNNIKQFVFGSSSSVYGNTKANSFREDNLDLLPISPYASSKISAEKAGYTYSHLYGIRFLALRFFTVFGPRQRPDLAISKFISKISNKMPIEVYGDGSTGRDYTYVTDIVSGIISAINYKESLFDIFNLGNHSPINLKDLIANISTIMEVEPILKYVGEQAGDVSYTCADISKAGKYLNYNPQVKLVDGIKAQVEWLKENHFHSKASIKQT